MGAAVRTENIGDYAPRKLPSGTLRPLLEKPAALLFAVAVGVVAFLLNRAGKQHVRRDLFRLHRINQLPDQTDIRVINHSRVRMAVHCRQMYNRITAAHKFTQAGGIGEKSVFPGNPLKLLRHGSQQIIKIGPHKTGLTGNTDSNHFTALQSNQ